MPGVGGTEEVIVLKTEGIPLLLKFGRDSGGELLGSFAGSPGGTLHFLAVLVGSRGEHHFEPLHALEACDGLGGHGRIRVPDVGGRIHVVQGSGQVVFHELLL